MPIERRPNDDDSDFHRYHRGDIGRTPVTLLDRLRSKNKEAINTFVDLYTKLVRVWCRRASKKLNEPILRDERKDIASQVIEKAVRKLCDENGEPIKRLRAWLYRVTEHCIIDYLRQRNKRKQVWQLMDDADCFETLPDKYSLDLSDEQTDRLVIFGEIAKRIKQTIKPEHWEVFQQTFFEGKNSEDVAKVMNISSDNVRQIKRRVLDRVRMEYSYLGLADERPEMEKE